MSRQDVTFAVAAARRARRRAGRGYTVLEVMIALALLTTGIVGIVAMQKTAILANTGARNLDAARSVAAAWLERLRADAAVWTDAGGVPNIGTTRWLNVVGNDFPTITGGEDAWFVPTAIQGMGISPIADVRGQDTFTATEAAFCTHVKLTQLMPTMIRAEVRVLWLRDQGNGNNSGTLNGKALCDPDPAYLDLITNDATSPQRYHFVYVASAILRNDAAS